jgi:hypothetical protein
MDRVQDFIVQKHIKVKKDTYLGSKVKNRSTGCPLTDEIYIHSYAMQRRTWVRILAGPPVHPLSSNVLLS